MSKIIKSCAAYPIINAFRKEKEAHYAQTISSLIDEWKEDSKIHSSLRGMEASNASKELIKLGYEAVPHIISELEKHPDHWFSILSKITSENPVQDSSRGKINSMTNDWLKWAKKKGLYEKAK